MYVMDQQVLILVVFLLPGLVMLSTRMLVGIPAMMAMHSVLPQAEWCVTQVKDVT